MKARMAFAATLLAGTASSAFAAPSCTPEALNALHVASVTVTEATPVAATCAASLGKGYVTAVTDTGHVGNGTDASWVRMPDGRRDEAKVTDFLHRAAHDVALAGKQFAQAFYGTPVQHAYFDGCSTGGRMAMM